AALMVASPSPRSGTSGSVRSLIMVLGGHRGGSIVVGALPVHVLRLVHGGGVTVLALLAGGDGGHLLPGTVDRLARGAAPEEEADHAQPGLGAEARVEPAAAEEAEHDRDDDLQPERPP